MSEVKVIEIKKSVFEENGHEADELRSELKRKGTSHRRSAHVACTYRFLGPLGVLFPQIAPCQAKCKVRRNQTSAEAVSFR